MSSRMLVAEEVFITLRELKRGMPFRWKEWLTAWDAVSPPAYEYQKTRLSTLSQWRALKAQLGYGTIIKRSTVLGTRYLFAHQSIVPVRPLFAEIDPKTRQPVAWAWRTRRKK